MHTRLLKLFLRFGIAAGFLSAVADRLGFWPQEVSAWGNWESFLAYTALINPWAPDALIPAVGIIATAAETILGICLLLGFRTALAAKASGFLMLGFALAIAFSTGIKGTFDYSVFAASGAAFALGTMKEKYLELDLLLIKNN
jgi:uncharacterized membrane protein YphA (DoxX/SURF4 family)